MSGPMQGQIVTINGRVRQVSDLPEPEEPEVCRVCGYQNGWIPWSQPFTWGPCPACEKGMASMGVPERFRQARISDFAHLPSLASLADWDGSAPGFYVYGPVGAGKTHLAAALCRLAVEKGRRAKFLQTGRFLAKVRESYGNEEAQLEVRDDQDKLAQADVVVLDDLGGERPTDWALEQMLFLIDKLYNREPEVALIVTSNLSLDELGTHLDPRAASRILGLARRPLKMDLPDRRLSRVQV